MAEVLHFAASTISQPADAAVMSRAVILFLIIVCGLGALLLGIIALNRSRRLRRNASARDQDAANAGVDPWKEAARRLRTDR